MTREEVIRLAKEAFSVEFISESDSGKLERFAELVAAEEREACAVVCDELADADPYETNGYGCAAKIRARGDSK